MRERGVGDTTQIVAYDAGGDMFAPRFWFLARWIGHEAVAVLDGGFTAWNLAGYPVDAVRVPLPAEEGNLTLRLRPEFLVDADYVSAHLNDPAMQLLDARAKERYSGETEPIDPVAGHIPGARHRWFKENFAPDGRLKSREELRAEFERAESRSETHRASMRLRRLRGSRATSPCTTPASKAHASTTARGANGYPTLRARSQRANSALRRVSQARALLHVVRKVRREPSRGCR